MKLNPGLSWQEQHSARGKFFLVSKLNLNMRKKLVKYYIWIIAVYGAENWSESTSEMPGHFLNVVLMKDRKDQLDRSCEK